MATNEVAVGKRLEIKNIQKQMFYIVAGAGVLVGVAIVAMIYFVKVIMFNMAVLGAQGETIDLYNKNYAAIEKVEAGIQGLREDDRLESVAKMRGAECDDPKLSEEMQATCSALRVIPDSLPMEGDSTVTALGVSLTSIISKNEPYIMRESSNVGGSQGARYDVNSVGATFTVAGSTEGISGLLRYFERSIRPFTFDSMNLEWGAEGRLQMSVRADSFFVTPVTVQKKMRIVKAVEGERSAVAP